MTHAFAHSTARICYHCTGTSLIITIRVSFDLRSCMQMSCRNFLEAVKPPAWQKCSSKGRAYLMEYYTRCKSHILNLNVTPGIVLQRCLNRDQS